MLDQTITKLCKCGCGAELTGNQREFRRGHWNRLTAVKPPQDVIERDGKCRCGCGQQAPMSTRSAPKQGYYIGYPMEYIRGHNASPDQLPHKEKPERYYDNGYIYVWAPDHPEAMSHRHHRRVGYVLEHRLNWEQANGRRLTRREHVHHINEIRDDNRPENLQALSPEEHKRLHAKDKVVSAETRAKLSIAGTKAWAEGRGPRKRHP